MSATLDTAFAYQLSLSPRSDKLDFSHVENVVNPNGAHDFSALIAV